MPEMSIKKANKQPVPLVTFLYGRRGSILNGHSKCLKSHYFRGHEFAPNKSRLKSIVKLINKEKHK